METTPAQSAPVYANRKVKYYQTHKNDPGFRDKLKQSAKSYYERNRDQLKQKALDRYYQIKAALTPTLAV